MNKNNPNTPDNKTANSQPISDQELNDMLETLKPYQEDLVLLNTTPEPTGKEATILMLHRLEESNTTHLDFYRIIMKNKWIAVSACLIIAAGIFLPPLTTQSRVSNRPTASAPGEPNAVATLENSDMSVPKRTGAPETFGGVTQETQSSSDSLSASKVVPQRTITGAESNTGGSLSSPMSTSIMNRDIIYSGVISLEVENLSKSMDTIKSYVIGRAGFIENSNVSSSNQIASGTVTLRIPSKSFEATLKYLGTLGRILEQSSQGEDVTAQVVDLEARTKVLKASEESLLQILRTTRRTGEILEVRDRLTEVRSEIEQMQSQISNYKNLSKLSTISVQMTQISKLELDSTQNWFEESTANSRNALVKFGKFLANLAIWTVTLAPIWLPIALIAWFIKRKNRAI